MSRHPLGPAPFTALNFTQLNPSPNFRKSLSRDPRFTHAITVKPHRRGVSVVITLTLTWTATVISALRGWEPHTVSETLTPEHYGPFDNETTAHAWLTHQALQ
jgi:hypothetical protein